MENLYIDNLSNIEEVQKNILKNLKSKELIEKAKELKLITLLVFGSILKEDFNEESDVDIAILGEDTFKLKDILRFEMFLEDLLNRKIDVVDLNSLNLDVFIKINILNSGKTVYTSDNDVTLNELIDKVEWYYRQNESFFKFRKRDLLDE